MTLTMKYWHGLIISESPEWVLTSNRNTWDTNYHLINKITGIDHLIDMQDHGNLFQYSVDKDLKELLGKVWKSCL